MQVNLVYFKPGGGRKDIPISKAAVVLGRRMDCDVRIPQMGVSRRHCELVAADDGLKVRDLGSSNGTYINGERVDEKPVGAGDLLQIGAIVLTVQVDGEPADVSAPAAPQAPDSGSVEIDSDATDATDEDVFAQLMMDDDDDDDDDDDSMSALEMLEDQD